MANDVQITLVGNLVDDPELRFTNSGAAVASFRVASTPRTFDRQSGEWKDGEALFLTCSVWRQYAENVAETLTRGMRVIVQGRLKQRSYEKDGQKRTVYEVDVEEVGPALRSATAKVTKTQRQGDGFNGGGGGFGAPAPQNAPARQGGFGAPASADPWGPGGRPGFADEAPPF
ncbi:single-stranded DNA-binding protein [Nocardiopsis alba]